MRNLGESCRLPPNLPQPGEANYVLGPWDSEDLQGAVDSLASGQVVGDKRRHDLLLQVGLRGRDVHLPRQGIAFTCEACGDAGRVYGQSGSRVEGVPWTLFPDRERVEVAMRSVSSDVGDRLVVRPYGEGWVGYRMLVVCAACARSHQGKRGLQRCWHEEPFGDANWRRCQEVVVGRDFCARHASRGARHRREIGEARRASASVDYLVADATPAELSGPSLLLLTDQIRKARESGQAEDLKRLEDDQRRVLRVLRRIADL